MRTRQGVAVPASSHSTSNVFSEKTALSENTYLSEVRQLQRSQRADVTSSTKVENPSRIPARSSTTASSLVQQASTNPRHFNASVAAAHNLRADPPSGLDDFLQPGGMHPRAYTAAGKLTHAKQCTGLFGRRDYRCHRCLELLRGAVPRGSWQADYAGRKLGQRPLF